jgi:hypothetical protein
MMSYNRDLSFSERKMAALIEASSWLELGLPLGRRTRIGTLSAVSAAPVGSRRAWRARVAPISVLLLIRS